MKGRAVFWLVAGVAGLALGAAAALWDVVAFGVVAGACALVAGVSAYRLVTMVRRRSEQVDHLNDQVSELEETVQREAEARAQAEADRDAVALADRIDRTAVRRDPEAEALIDDDTGLFSESYFSVAVDVRVAAARRHLRPVALVLMEVIEGLGTELPHLADPETVAAGIRQTLRDSDTACRLQGGGYGLLLEDTPENGAIWAVERLRRQLSTLNQPPTVWAGIACYPAHGFDASEILGRAELALAQAKEWRQDRIEVATAD
jgi:diguanylate cyclase (GGDEF)-like protein